jgi:hypothetical protein
MADKKSRLKKSPRDVSLVAPDEIGGIKELMQIPGVGKSIANDLWNIGIQKVADLQNKNPEQLYLQSNKFANTIQDRCLLYVFRCAVYYAKTPPAKRDIEKLRWWWWKDRNN